MEQRKSVFQQGSNVEGRWIKSGKELTEIVNACRTLGKKIVLVSGTFDLLHMGHCRYLEGAKGSLNDPENTVCIVGVDSDDKVREKKGPDRPIVSEKERIEILCHIRHVDIVFKKDKTPDKWNLIKIIKPDALVISERTGYSDSDKEELRKICGTIIELKSQAESSTTARIRFLIIDFAKEIHKSFENAEIAVKQIFSNFKNEIEEKIKRGDRHGS